MGTQSTWERLSTTPRTIHCQPQTFHLPAQHRARSSSLPVNLKAESAGKKCGSASGRITNHLVEIFQLKHVKTSWSKSVGRNAQTCIIAINVLLQILSPQRSQ